MFSAGTVSPKPMPRLVVASSSIAYGERRLADEELAQDQQGHRREVAIRPNTNIRLTPARRVSREPGQRRR